MSEQNRAIVQQGYAAFGRGDIPALLELLSEDVEWETPGTSEFPLAGKRRGHQQVVEFFQTLNATFEIQRFVPETFVAEGDRVIVQGRETALIRATGKVIEVPWAHAFTLRNGKIVALQEYVDTAAIVAELRSAQALT
jgi:ketosteroid isomerase-like protein